MPALNLDDHRLLATRVRCQRFQPGVNGFVGALPARVVVRHGLLKQLLQAAYFLLALLARNRLAQAAHAGIATSKHAEGRWKLDVQGQRIHNRHLLRHPARQVDERALAGDERTRRSSEYGRHAVGARDGD